MAYIQIFQYNQVEYIVIGHHGLVVGEVSEYGQCPNTDTVGISEIINPTLKNL